MHIAECMIVIQLQGVIFIESALATFLRIALCPCIDYIQLLIHVISYHLSISVLFYIYGIRRSYIICCLILSLHIIILNERHRTGCFQVLGQLGCQRIGITECLKFLFCPSTGLHSR